MIIPFGDVFEKCGENMSDRNVSIGGGKMFLRKVSLELKGEVKGMEIEGSLGVSTKNVCL